MFRFDKYNYSRFGALVKVICNIALHLDIATLKAYTLSMDENIAPTQQRGPGRPRTITALDIDCLREHVYHERTLQDVATAHGSSREAIRQHVAKFPDEIRRSKVVTGRFLTWYANQPTYLIPYGVMLDWLSLRLRVQPAPDASRIDGVMEQAGD